MFIALVILTALLAVICVQSASMKLRRNERVLAVIHGTVGVPQRHLPVLAALELAGAAGILVGLWLEPLGIAAAAVLVAYFVGAVIGTSAWATPRSSRCRCRRSCSPRPCSSSAF